MKRMMNKNTMEFKKLKTFLTTPIKNGYSPVCTDVETSKTILGLGALTGQSIDLSKIKWVPETNKKTDNFLINPGDFLVSRSNTLDKVGRSALYRGGLNNCAYPDLIMKFRIDEATILPDFLEVLLQSSLARKHFMQRASGTSSSMVKITKSVLESLPIPLLPLQTQKKIAELAASWDKAIDKMKGLIAAKEKQFEWLKQYHFKRCNAISNCCELSHIAQFFDGYPFKSSEYCPNGQFKIVTIGNVQNGYLLHSFKGFLEKIPNNLSPEQILKRNDLVISMTGNVGRVCRIDIDNCLLNQRVGKIVLNENIDKDFIFFSLLDRDFLASMQSFAQGGAQGNLSKRDILKYELLIPPLSEQKKISNDLNICIQEINLLKRLVENYLQQKCGLMQMLLTGKGRIKNEELELA